MEVPQNARSVQLKKDAKCSLCTCGQSKTLPYCDNAHREYNEKNGTTFKSLKIFPHGDCEVEVHSSTWE